jgi:hypothetical protein
MTLNDADVVMLIGARLQSIWQQYHDFHRPGLHGVASRRFMSRPGISTAPRGGASYRDTHLT